MLLLFLVNLGFAGGGEPVVPPATTAGGGRKEKQRIRYSRAMAYYEPIREGRKKLKQEAKQQIEELAKELIEKQELDIEQARARARQVLLLGSIVDQALSTEAKLNRMITRDRLQTVKVNQHIKRIRQDEEAVLLAILMASETYEA